MYTTEKKVATAQEDVNTNNSNVWEAMQIWVGGGRVGETCGAVNSLDLMKQLSPDMREKGVEREELVRGVAGFS